MKMDIILKDKTTQEVIESKCESNKIVVDFDTVEDVDAFRKKLTNDNLSEFKYKKNDKIIGEYESYTLENTTYVENDGMIEATFSIRQLNDLEIRVNILEDAVADMSETVYA